MYHYRALKPCPLLEPFVERYYVLERGAETQECSRLTVPACYTAALVFSYADPVARQLADGTGEQLPRSFITGPALQGSMIRLEGRAGIVGVTLKSAGFLRFFGLSAVDVLNQRIDLESVAGREISELGEQLCEAAESPARVAIVEAYLLRRLALHRSGTPDWIDEAVDILAAHKGRVSIDALATRSNISSRQLRRRFTDRTGLGPKLFARLKRFGYAHVLLSQQPHLDMQDIVFRAGYYDQAHLIKDFVAFGGCAPSVLRS